MRIAPVNVATMMTGLLLACTNRPDDRSGSSESKLVSDIAVMTQNPDGTFEVTCKDGRQLHALTSDTVRSNLVCSRAVLECDMQYFLYADEKGCPGMYCPPVPIATLKKPISGFPLLDEKVGAESLPYRAEIRTFAGSTPADGTFYMAVVRRATDRRHSNMSSVSLAPAASTTFAPIVPGNMRNFVDEFTHEGQRYNVVDFDCSVKPADP